MEAPKPSPDYLMQLMNDRRVAGTAPLSGVFAHVDRLLEQEITRVRADMYGESLNGGGLGRPRVLLLPEPKGSPVQLQEKLFVPVKDYPDFNFVGRILGPRGLTAKQLESETGCRIMVRGRGSMRDKKKEEQNRGKPNWEHLSEELHVLVTVEDSPNRADVKLRHAVDEVKKLLVPSGEGEDNLKKLQLMELAIINGTYRDAAQPRHREYCTQGQLQQLQHHHQQQQQLQQLQQQQQLPFATSMVPAPPPMAFTMAGPPLTAAHGHRFLAAAAAAAQQLHLAGPGAQQFHLRGASPGGGQVPGGMGGVPGVPGVPSPGMCLPFMRPLHPMLGGPGVPGVPGVPADTPGLVYTSYEYPCLLEYPLDHTGVLGAVPTKVRRHDSRVHPYQRDRVGGSRPPATTEGGGATLTTTSGPPGG